MDSGQGASMAAPSTSNLGLSTATSASTPNGSATANISNSKVPAAKKLTIKPLKRKKLRENFEDATWSMLKGAVCAIHRKEAVACSLNELYDAVNSMCIHGLSEKLYNNLYAECQNHIRGRLQDLAQASVGGVLSLHLKRVNECWTDHCDQMLLIRSIFLYLDRTFVMQKCSVRSLWDMGLALFRENLQNLREVETNTVVALLNEIENDRKGETVDKALLKSVLRMLSSLQMYHSSFEKQFLQQTEDFYRAESSRYLQQADVSDYLKHCEERLSNEYVRCNTYLDVSSRTALVRLVEKALLYKHSQLILERGFEPILNKNRLEDLRRMYVLLGKVDAHAEMRAEFLNYVRKHGRAIVADDEKEKAMVQALLNFKDGLDKVMEDSFQDNPDFSSAMKEGFESFINVSQRPAELIARFLDSKLRLGNKGQTEEELEMIMDQVLVLFRFIQGKDVFEAFYKNDLARRLLLGKSASFDAEKSMISKLKSECGSQFTSKLEGMFKDIDISQDIVTSFRTSNAAARLPTGIEMSVQVLTRGYWPKRDPVNINIPKVLDDMQEIFKEFYLFKHSGRRLVWQHTLGTCVLKANFPKGKKELSVSLFQAIVLLPFNMTSCLSFEDLKVTTAMDSEELRRTLQGLACGKIRVLRKEPKGRDVNDEDVFHFNDDFSEKLHRIKINSIQMKETAKEKSETQEKIFADRIYQVDAAIVRIMKTRKTLSHQQLILELLKQLKFPTKPADLKKRIENLIEREYIERDKDNSSNYLYLA